MGLGIPGGMLPCIALVDIRDFDAIPGHVLHLLRQLLPLVAVLCSMIDTKCIKRSKGRRVELDILCLNDRLS